MKGILIILISLNLFISKYEIKINSENHEDNIKHQLINKGININNYDFDFTLRIPIITNLNGCSKHIKYSDKIKNGILIKDSDKCSISTQIHFAQEANISIILIEYEDEKIEEVEIDLNLQGVYIPIFLIENSTGQKLRNIKNSIENNEELILNINHKMDEISNTHNIIDFWYSPDLFSDLDQIIFDLEGKMDNFIKKMMTTDSKIHKKLEFNLKIALGYCKKCSINNYLIANRNCFSGGKYCALSNSGNDEFTMIEIINQICIREVYSSLKLLEYLKTYYNEFNKLDLKEKNIYPVKSDFDIIRKFNFKNNNINIEEINKCIDSSMKAHKLGEKPISLSLNDNYLLEKEFENYSEISNFSIRLPAVMINSIPYSGQLSYNSLLSFFCKNNILHCNHIFSLKYKNLIKYFLLVAFFITLILTILCLRTRMKKKMNGELDLQVQKAIQKYLNSK